VLDLQLTFRSIARCPNVNTCLNAQKSFHPCGAIVLSQSDRCEGNYELFQVPEPWVGQIDVAPILFVSSNPSIGEDDHSSGNSPGDRVWESHHLAFGGGSRPYIIDGVWTTNAEGAKLKRVPYWSWVRNRAQELIPDRAVVPGIDYALTEIVHCKSTDEVGVPEAAQTCAELHFDKLMSVSAAKVVVVVGRIAKKHILGDIAPTKLLEREMGGKPRVLTFLWHPASFEDGKKFATRYSPDDMQRLIQIVAGTA
jgi:uracil-DNA glycosylase